jgi:serine-type D-Ala-D-Ala carboxypeptidase/endopeptidase (penicillin-binding protein 4)
MHRRSLSTIALFLLGGCAGAHATTQPSIAARSGTAALRVTIDSLVNAREFRNAHWGILIVDPANGDTLYSHNAGKLFMPASNMKLLTGSTALTQLGPDFRYRTTIAAKGAVRDGVLDGDLLVIGRGDPTVSDHMRSDAMLGLAEIADSLAARGVHRVTGRVVAAGNAFPGSVFGFGWTYDDFEDDYSAPIDELNFNEGFSTIIVRGGAAPGDPVTVTTTPARTFPRVRVLATTIAPSAELASASGNGTQRRRATATRIDVTKDSAYFGGFVLTGVVQAADSVAVTVTHHDPDDAYVAALSEALRARGIGMDGAVTSDSVSRVDTMFVVQSLPMRDIMPALMKPSQNQIAEILLRTLGLERTGVGSPDSGRAVVVRQLLAWGADSGGYLVRDGSGLSRYDYVTPETIVHVLNAMKQSPQFQLFYESLPIAGVDGTIRTRMKGTKAEGNLHAKTGTVAQARSLSGYVTTADGRMLLFSMLCNNFTTPVSEVTRAQDVIGAALALLGAR